MARGRLIVFEGVEGAGKSTQLDRLAGHLARRGIAHRAFREPGGTPLGDEIRRVLLDPASHVSPRAEALLFLASRAELVSRELRPALAAGVVVLLDRFFLSTYAYQIAGRELPSADVRAANLIATEGLVPDLTLLFTLSASEGLARARRRGGRDRIELSDDAFHDEVERAFAAFTTPEWQRTHEECGPIVAVDAAGSEREVEARVLDAITSRFGELRALVGAVA
ncbi:MAG TPA: dTMP kinase [Gemmatimonadaceae bacterium]|nr:dTMP kinase [Gemmatimonadaceae bacterium]